jgi:hypothetical protein
MSQTAWPIAASKLPVWGTIGAGARIGFKHFWMLVGVTVAFYALSVLLIWLFGADLFRLMIDMQTSAGTMPAADPQVAVEYARRMVHAFFNPPVLVLLVISLVLTAAFWALVWRVVALGPGEAFKGDAGRWMQRTFLVAWRYICASFASVLVVLAIGIVWAIWVGLGVLLFKILPGIPIGLVIVLGILAFTTATFVAIPCLAAIFIVSLIGTSCDEHVTLRGAFALLKGNRLRASGTLILSSLFGFIVFSIFVTTLDIAGVIHLPVPGSVPGEAVNAGANVHEIIGIYLAELIFGIPLMVWGMGIGVAIYRFVIAAGEGSPVPAPA